MQMQFVLIALLGMIAAANACWSCYSSPCYWCQQSYQPQCYSCGGGYYQPQSYSNYYQFPYYQPSYYYGGGSAAAAAAAASGGGSAAAAAAAAAGGGSAAAAAAAASGGGGGYPYYGGGGSAAAAAAAGGGGAAAAAAAAASGWGSASAAAAASASRPYFGNYYFDVSPEAGQQVKDEQTACSVLVEQYTDNAIAPQDMVAFVNKTFFAPTVKRDYKNDATPSTFHCCHAKYGRTLFKAGREKAPVVKVGDREVKIDYTLPVLPKDSTCDSLIKRLFEDVSKLSTVNSKKQ